MQEVNVQKKSVPERMQEIKAALGASDPKGVVAKDFGKDSVTLGAIRRLLKLRHVEKKDRGLYLTQIGREQPLIPFGE
jgi:hypothetical protein